MPIDTYSRGKDTPTEGPYLWKSSFLIDQLPFLKTQVEVEEFDFNNPIEALVYQSVLLEN